MYLLLLSIIYIAFISLGLPDSLIGSAWPVMHQSFDVPISYAGIVTMVISIGTIVSSLLSDRMTRKIGVGMVTAISVLMTAVALFGFSVSTTFLMLCIFAIPYGLGAGAVDAALNNYVALHYESRHMNWLHCFWGVGAMISPYIMSYYLVYGLEFSKGFHAVGIIQIGLVTLLLVTLPIWKWKNSAKNQTDVIAKKLTLKEAVNIRGVKLILITFFGYCGMESTVGLWASTYLVEFRNMDVESGAKYASLFFIGITVGRFFCGFVSDKLGDKTLIRGGIITCAMGIACLAMPFRVDTPTLVGLILIGLGGAPIYPAIIHATPVNFGRENAQAIVGIQMASAYTGTTLMPLLFGFIADYISISLYPAFLMTMVAVMCIASERLNRMKHE